MQNMKQLLEETKKSSGQIAQEYPDQMKGLGAFAEAMEGGDALDTKTKELIAVALSVVKQCTYCIAFHVKAALDAGATKDELMESTFVAVLMGGGPAFMYGKLVRQAIDDLGA